MTRCEPVAAFRRFRRTGLRGCWIALACVAWLGIASAAGDAVDSLETLPARQAIPALTQMLMSALPGDAAPWRRLMSDSAVYVSESGEVAGKMELLEAFNPFPHGITGSIEVKDPRVTDLGDVAVVVFDADERQAVYDQKIAVRYRSTHTWRRENGRWRLIAAQNVVLAHDPMPLPIDPRRLPDYVGTYELAGQRRYRVERRGDGLVGGRENGALSPLIPVGESVFADSGSALGVLRIFVRGRAGSVDRMVQRRKFADLTWSKMAAANPRAPARSR